jgi:hypothetical protein
MQSMLVPCRRLIFLIGNFVNGYHLGFKVHHNTYAFHGFGNKE